MIRWLALAAWLVTATEADEPPAPSLELLRFLGSFETAEGEWLDPFLLEGTGERPDEDHDQDDAQDDADAAEPARDPVDGRDPGGDGLG